MTQRPGDRHCLHPGDKVLKIGDYKIPGLVLSRFIMSSGAVRYAVEHKAEGGGLLADIYPDKDLELVERGFDGARADAESGAAITEVQAMRERFLAKVRGFDVEKRFRVSDSWRDDMTASEIYGTGICDAAAFILEELTAMPIDGGG